MPARWLRARASVTLTVAASGADADVDGTASPVAVPMAGYTVRPGDTLWSIADVRLGDGADWTSIAALNLGRDVAPGARLVDPDHIRAGWHLRLPHDGDRGHSAPTGSPAGSQPRRELPTHLPELVALGLGSLTCAALARRSRRQRRLDRFGDDLDPLPLLSEPAVDTAALLDRFHGVPALAAFEKANCLLGSLVHERAGAPSPVVRAICVGPAGVAFWLAQPDLDAPGGFSAGGGGATWQVEHSRLEHVDVFYPYVPIALPVGDDDDGTWLVALGPGDVLPVLGDSAPALCRAARSALESWAWADMVTVADDPGRSPSGRPWCVRPADVRPLRLLREPRHPDRCAGAPRRGRHHGDGGGHRPHGARGPPGRHPPPAGPGRPPPAPVGADGRAHRRADGSPGRACAPGRRHRQQDTARATAARCRLATLPASSTFAC